MRTRWLILAVLLLGGLASAEGANELKLFPAEFGGATCTKAARAYDAKTIYDYMDGHADVYLRFDYRQLYAAEYQLDKHLVVVELFDMGSAPEAYGVFSMAQGGTAVGVGQAAHFQDGALGVWTGRFFLKIAGEDDSSDFRTFATKLAEQMTTPLGGQGLLPDLLACLLKELQPSGPSYFHTVEDFNTLSYLSTENVLGLAKGQTDVVFANGVSNNRPLKIAVVRYRDFPSRAAALNRLNKVIYSAKATKDKDGTKMEQMAKDQFTATRAFLGPNREPMLALVMEAKTAEEAREAVAVITQKRR